MSITINTPEGGFTVPEGAHVTVQLNPATWDEFDARMAEFRALPGAARQGNGGGYHWVERHVGGVKYVVFAPDGARVVPDPVAERVRAAVQGEGCRYGAGEGQVEKVLPHEKEQSHGR